MFFNTKKFGLGALLSIFVFVTIFGSAFFSLKPAHAQMDANITTAFIQWETTGIATKVKETLKEKAQFMFMSALMNGLNYFANKIAYDMGVWLASGDWGQGPFASGKSFGNYMAQVAGDSLGEMLGSLSEDLGLNLCDLPDLRLDLALQLGFHFAYNEPKPKCTWQQLRAAYNPENVYSKYASREGLADRIGMGVSVKDTDFGVWFKSKERIDAYTAEQSTGKQLDRQEGEGISALTEIISGEQKVPATVMKDELKAQAPAKQKDDRSGYTNAMVGAALQKGATSVALNAVSTFVNTLLGTVVTNFVEKGMFPGGAKICNPGLSISGVGWDQCSDTQSESLASNYYSSGAASTGNRRAAQEMFSELLAPKIKTLENYDPTPNLAECSPDNLAPDSCVVDQSFLQILQQSDLGEPMTIKQALEMGLLHGDWKLYSENNEAMNQKRDCALSAYCHRNIRFMRLLRILPLGFEIAAMNAPDGSEPTLQAVIDGYYTVGSPYYKLINPYWVLTYPKTRCGAFAYSAIGTNGMHLQTCADIQHCVAFNKDGSCSSWGYCLREKPVWKFSANYCDAQYSTCRAFTSDDGDASYLTRTLDTTECNAGNAGCARYSRFKYYVSSSTVDWLAQTSGFFPLYGTFVNSGINFDNSVSACDASNDGCSAFKLASNEATLLYLKKAPDYLGCYDADSSSDANPLALFNKKLANGIQWPQTISDLNLIHPQDKKACENYTQVCLPEEEYCNYYTASLTGEKIPAKFTPAVVNAGIVTWNDQCDAKCAGYAAYSEMPSNYSSGQNLTYIIPSSGKICSASESGCSAFTNLNATAGGLEQNEYFSYLRLCALPDQTKQRNYTVYESSEVGGYQIKTYTLVKDDVGNGPKQIYRDADEYAEMSGLCDAGVYASGDADPDCHQFIAEGGTIYYAFLSKTIIATDQCNPYRLNTTELFALTPTDLRCPYDYDPNGVDYRAGASTVEFKNNTCYFMGFTGSTNGAGDTRTCTPAAESCRAYKGNAGNNVRILVHDDFESGIPEDWGSPSTVSITSSTESTQLGGQSLRVMAAPTDSLNFNAHLSNISVTAGKSYTLSFWMKGNMPVSRVSFNGTDHNVSFTDNTISASDVWQYYSFGPLNYDALATTTALTFTLGSTSGVSKQIFIDNVRLTEVIDYIYLVKNSLEVDPICDSNISDDLPGEALGCTAYSDPFKNMFYLTGFNYLCREAAVGCTAVLDTFNTPDDPNPRAYNVWITGTGGSITSVTLDGETFSCQVPNGETGCYTDIHGFTAAELEAEVKIDLTNSTVYIPPDTSTSTPIYLVANKEATCKAENMGCETLGKAAPSMSGLAYAGADDGLFVHYEAFEETSVLNNPALYDDTLCRNEEAGCKTWASGNSTYYFKTPFATCEYKTETFTAITPPDPMDTIGLASMLLGVHANSSGWVLQNTGFCITATVNPFYMGRACASDNDCKVGTATGTCQFIGQVPCYPLSRKSTGEYGIWSFGNTIKYLGFAGTCPQEQSGCTEYVDHSSSGDNYKCAATGEVCASDSDCETEGDSCEVNINNAYYLIDDDKFQTQEAACNGQVSQAEGCVVLDNTNNPNKFWNTSSSYALSQNNNGGLVAPVDEGGENDANTIIKVTHDRVCGEWAYCDLKQEYEDEETGEVKNRCFHLGVCRKAGGINTIAGRIVKDCAEPATSWDTKGLELTAGVYTGFMEAWDSWDFSGYSMYHTYQVPDVSARPIKPVGAEESTYRLVHVYSEYNFDFAHPTAAYHCHDPKEAGSTGAACGTGSKTGKCYNGECVTAFWKGNVDGSTILTCRAYPEESSPFRDNILVDRLAEVLEYKAGYEGSNLCYNNSGNPTDCDYADFCSYRRLATTGGDVLKPITIPMEANYICVSGDETGRYCNDPNSTAICGEGGTCAQIKSTRLMSGWMGYCMESDKRQTINGTTGNACMTWWPIEAPPGVPNYWDTDPNAGYEIAEGPQDRFMCLENEPILKYQKNSYTSTAGQGQTTNERIVVGGKMVGIESPKAFGNYDFQAFPKNAAYKMYEVTDGIVTKRIALTNLPQNTAVAGCYNASSHKYEYGFVVYDSAGLYCPINKDTLILDGTNHDPASETGGYMESDATMAFCTASEMVWDDASSQYTCNEWNPWNKNTGLDLYFHATQRNWIADDYKTDYIHRYEIERIDVFIDRTAKDKMTGNGWVSFVRDAVDADVDSGGRSFVAESAFSDEQGDANIYTVELDELGLYGWTAWQYSAGTGRRNWTTSDGTNNKQNIVNLGIENDAYQKVNINSTDPDARNISVRVVWDDNEYLRGIWLNGEGTDGDGHGIGDSTGEDGLDVGVLFVVHFTHGKCKTFGQLSDSSKAGEIDFKPYPNYLLADEFNYPQTSRDSDSSNQYIYIRKPSSDINGGKYGLAYGTESGYVDIRTVSRKAAFLNPFTLYNHIPDTGTHGILFHTSQAGDITANYGFTGYYGGVPLVSYDSNEARAAYPTYNNYTSSIDMSTANPYANVLSKMFRKISNIWTNAADTSGFDAPYASSTGYDSANPTKSQDISKDVFPPIVAAPTDGSWQLNAISVNGTTSGNIYLISGAQTHIKFYAWAHGNQMPVRQVVTDKGDGKDNWVDTGMNDALSNRKPVCSSDACSDSQVDQSGWQFPCNSSSDCAPLSGSGLGKTVCYGGMTDYQSFGNTSETGCKAKPWDIVADYNCPFGTMGVVYKTYTGSQIVTINNQEVQVSDLNIDWTYINQHFYSASYVCVAQPRVHVLDNWGWCTGNCNSTIYDSTAVESDGCYSDKTTNDCDTGRREPWVNYDGYVVVVPVVQ